MFRALDTGHDDFEKYLDTIGSRFCPFLEPARGNEVLFFSKYTIEETKVETLKQKMFYLSFIHTELLRRARAEEEDKQRANLICENLIFRFPSEDDVDGAELLSIPHWLLKCAYTQVGVLFGKFWKGEQDTAKSGEEITPPPLHFISIRSALKPVDSRFFTKARILENAYRESEDDGRSVFAHLFTPQQRDSLGISDVENLPFADVSYARVMELSTKLQSGHMYETTYDWAMRLASDQTRST